MSASDTYFRVPPFPAFPSVSRYIAVGSIEEALTRVSRSLETRDGISLVIGPPGTGKSLLAKAIIEAYHESRDVIVVGESPIESPEAFHKHVLHHLDVEVAGLSESDLQLRLVDRINGREAASGGLVIVVDEAQSLSGEVLEAIRMTTNVMRRDEPRVCAVLCGGPSLEDTLARPSMQPFVQRIATRCYLHPFNAGETHKYIVDSITSCGADPEETISDDAIAAVHHACNGVPRLINQMMTQAIDCAAASDQTLITGEIVDRAWAQLQQLPSPIVDEPEFRTAPSTIEFGELDDLPEVSASHTPSQIVEAVEQKAAHVAPVVSADDAIVLDEPAEDLTNEYKFADMIDQAGIPSGVDVPPASDERTQIDLSDAPVAEFDFGSDVVYEELDNDVEFDQCEALPEVASQIEEIAPEAYLNANQNARVEFVQAYDPSDLISRPEASAAKTHTESDSQPTKQPVGLGDIRLDQLQTVSEVVFGALDPQDDTAVATSADDAAAKPCSENCTSGGCCQDDKQAVKPQTLSITSPTVGEEVPQADPLPAALFGSFSEETEIDAVATNPVATQKIDCVTDYDGHVDAECTANTVDGIHEEIVGMSSDIHALNVFPGSEMPVADFTNGFRRDAGSSTTRQPVLWMTETDEGDVVSDDRDLLIVEEEVPAEPAPAPSVTYDEDQTPVSVDFQAMLARMRASG